MEQLDTRSTHRKDKWLTYSGAAAAFLATTADADAQVVYTDVNPDSVLVSDSLEIDFDGDGNVDFTISHEVTSSGVIEIAGVNLALGAAGLGMVSSGYFYPNVLANGAPIAPGDPAWQTQTFGSLFYAAGSTGFGQWNGQSGYLGVRFLDAGGATHYAWIELQVATNAAQVVVVGYAYETQPDVAITAGDTGGSTGVGASAASPFSVDLFPNPASDQVSVGLPSAMLGAVRIRVLNTIGQALSTQQVLDPRGGNVLFDIATLAPGTYFLEVHSGDQVVHRQFVKK